MLNSLQLIVLIYLFVFISELLRNLLVQNYYILMGNMSAFQNSLIAMFSNVSWVRSFCLIYMLFVYASTGCYLSGCAWLFIPDMRCHRFDTSVIGSQSRSANIFILSIVDNRRHGQCPVQTMRCMVSNVNAEFTVCVLGKSSS